MSRPGPKSTFTVEVGNRILAAFRDGCFASTAAQSCMVIPKTLLRWVISGQKNSAPEDLRAFSDEFLRIDAERERQVIKRIQASADPQEVTIQRSVTEANGDVTTTAEVKMVPGDVKALQWYASKRWPRRWGDANGGYRPDTEEVQPSKVIEEAEGVDPGLDEIFEDMPPELEAALMRNADRVRALLEKAKG